MFHKTLILDNSKLNIGAGLTFRQVKELVNGYKNIGATLIDFKNFQRDIKCYIGLRDADLFIDRLEKLKATQPQFYFAYDVDSQNRLTKFFWADATCIRNYSFFGDAVSFYPTYGTNKYDMVFTPFTSVNHHRKSVLFAGCLLLHEDDISFQWTFQHFLTAMGQKEPQFMITDQCPGIKKITDKVGSKTLLRDTDFLARFNAVVWDPDMEPSEFEEKWQKVISDFELEDNDWLTTMFQTAMDQQRYTRRCDDYNSDHSFPELKTELPIEKHGAIIYTHAVFKVFQEEVMAADSCGVHDFEKEEHAYCVGVQGQRNWANTKQLDSNGNVNEDSYMATSDNSHLCNVWSEFRQIVGVLKTLPAEHTEDSSSEVTIHPPEQARNKGSGKRLKSAKEQAIEKVAKPKRLCAYCKERVTHDRRTCPLRIADEAAEKAAKKKKV
ncbi:protein FAR-RED IMPAIRED RESPONSE 1-like [Silene latifolia]|uniref:protein FAR-RED IMPAIRED RESPONSE 1-like n=1 Tax=Silene latifolia TaxID=37657 RepID=UPI003D78765F